MASGKVYKPWETESSIRIPITGKDEQAYIYKYGKVIFFSSPADGTFSSGTNQIGVVPVGYRPRVTLRIPISNSNGHFVTFGTSGGIDAYHPTATTTKSNYSITATWFIA